MASFSDDFNRTNGAVGSNYTLFWGATNSLSVVSNECAPGSDEEFMYYNGASFGADQYVEIEFRSNTASVGYVGGFVRLQGTPGASPNGYFFDCITFDSGSTWGARIIRIDSGTEVGLTSASVTPVAGDKLRLTITGSSLVVSQNGTSLVSATDSTYSSGGYVGIRGYASNNSIHLDNFLAGDVTTSTFHTLLLLDCG